MPRGSALLVGVGGSGKQSLTRLASYIAGYQRFQIMVSKSYNQANLMEDVKNQYLKAGMGQPITFVFTDAEVKDESFLETINMILSTGEIPGLIPKDEQEIMLGELTPLYEKATGALEVSREDVLKYFYDNVRKFLHMVLCFSPVGEKFRDRALKFPALFSGTTIDWFLPWPKQALSDVAGRFIGNFEELQVESKEEREALVLHLSSVHAELRVMTGLYFEQFRRNVYVTPKTYLSFINLYKGVYKVKMNKVSEDAEKINTGLVKLEEAEVGVAKMQIQLAETNQVLARTSERIEKMLVGLRENKAKAEKVKTVVLKKKNLLAEQSHDISIAKDDANKDLKEALPALAEAEHALDAIKPDDIKALKALKNPPNIIKRIFDGVLILQRLELLPLVKVDPKTKTKGGMPVMETSYANAIRVMSQSSFLSEMKGFNTDCITDETCELLEPYLEMDDFTMESAAKASGNVAGLCAWVRAMVTYYKIAKYVAPKIEYVKRMEGELSAANRELSKAEMELMEKEKEVEKMNAEFEAAMAEKQVTQDEATVTKNKMDSANKLINGLAGEKVRWQGQSKEFSKVMRQLVGDCAVVASFITYCGPFNAPFRERLCEDIFRKDCNARDIPLSESIDVVKFMVDDAQIGAWALEGLPNDDLSLQNAIMTTRAERWPIMIDPQSQANHWIKTRDAKNNLSAITLGNKRFRMTLEDCMRDGSPLLIEDIEEELDPVLEPVLNKLIIRTGKWLKINLPDKEGCEYDDNFRLYFTTKMPNPHFTPELSAQSTVIDFTVTMQGLEDQLLANVVNRERADLEEARQNLLVEINAYKSKVLELEDVLLHKLSTVQGSLLEDPDIIQVLNNTKTTSIEVQEKLDIADETNAEISTAREEYRPVATRGSLIYFLFTEISLISNMYQVALSQFLVLFSLSMDQASSSGSTAQRCRAIIDELTFITFSYTTRMVFEKHKMVYTLLLALKIQIKAGLLSPGAFTALMKGGAALDIRAEKMKAVTWLPDSSWLNLIELERTVPVFKELTTLLRNNNDGWRNWIDCEAPEHTKIPDLQGKVSDFEKLCLVRAVREDRMLMSAKSFVLGSLGTKYLIFKPLDIEATWSESTTRVPMIFLLSPGSNPNVAIEALAKRLKIEIGGISMGQGQEAKADLLIDEGVRDGKWALLQNTHLGLGFMNTIEAKLANFENIHEDFRLWITSEPHPQFPIGLLQISIKMTDEPPSGLKAGLRKSYNAWLSTDWIEAVNSEDWRCSLFSLCFVHSVVQERRKFGSLGWNIPYEFNQSDLEASATYMKAHMVDAEMRKAEVSWGAIQYMTCEIQYGGRITDGFDRRLFNTYGERWQCPRVFEPEFEFGDGDKAKGYTVMRYGEIGRYRSEIENLADDDHPEAFGMHGNADITYRTKQTKACLDTIINIQPKDGGGAAGLSREQIVLEKALELLPKMPPDFDKAKLRSDLAKLNSGSSTPKPLNIHLKQEIDRMQVIIGITRTTLNDLDLAIAGTIIMTADLMEALDSIFDARVPPRWIAKSWKSPTLGLWFGQLVQRTQELNNWLQRGRPNSYWLNGFFNAQGFLTAVQQEVTRQHSGWSLDNVSMHTEITTYTKEQVEKQAALEEGVYVWGLYLDGAAWDSHDAVLVDPPPKQLFSEIPIMFITALEAKEKQKAMAARGNYKCPVYTIPARTGLNYVFTADVASADPGYKWILRGTALVCSKD